MRSKLLVGAAVAGVIGYAIWMEYLAAVIVSFVVALVTIGVPLLNRSLADPLWKRNKAGRRRESRMIVAGLVSAVICIFLMATGRGAFGTIGAELLVGVGLLVVFGTTLGLD